MSEQVLGFPAGRLDPFLPLFVGGAVTDTEKVCEVLRATVAPGLGFMERDKAETDPSFKQVIPYCVLCAEDENGLTYLAYRRTKKGGEARLHENWSLGVGGHINPCDAEESGPAPIRPMFTQEYDRGLRRELMEEVGFSYSGGITSFAPVMGLLYDDSNDVGKVHFGVVHLVPLPYQGPPYLMRMKFKDPALADGQWLSLKTLRQQGRSFENWSRLVIEHMLRK